MESDKNELYTFYATKKKRRIFLIQSSVGTILKKQCTACQKYKCLDGFRKSKGYYLNLTPLCKTCLADKEKQDRARVGIKQKKIETFTVNGDIQIKCKICDTVKSKDKFRKTLKTHLGYGAICKTCLNDRDKIKRRMRGIEERNPKFLTDSTGKVTHKSCALCKEIILMESFDKHKSGFLGKRSYCKKCTHEFYLKRKYGLTTIDKNKLYESQEKKCAICQISYDLNKLYIDHCHKTGNIRGLLCNSCNCAIGFLGDGGDKTILAAQKIISYLS